MPLVLQALGLHRPVHRAHCPRPAQGLLIPTPAVSS